MLMVDKDSLRRKGWRRGAGRSYTYPKHPKHFTLTLELKGRRVDTIEAEDRDGQRVVVFDRGRGFRRSDAKRAFAGRVSREVEAVIEALHNDYVITM
ncbi:MAG: hypothetical protein KUG77_20370 [Nannocystaceae bacterium]|nr:hypothetical protein [Nannocystaceae bacterium]